MKAKENTAFKKVLQAIPFIGLVVFVILFIHIYRLGLLQSPETLKTFIRRFGSFAPLAFMLLQIVQVIVPILPGGLSVGVGTVLFGPLLGFSYNYLGIVTGEVFGFLLVRRYGKQFLHLFLSQQHYDQYEKLMAKNNQNVKKVLIFALIVPFAPDDIVCLFSGLSNLTLREYLMIVLPLKVWSIGIYALMLNGLVRIFLFK